MNDKSIIYNCKIKREKITNLLTKLIINFF